MILSVILFINVVKFISTYGTGDNHKLHPELLSSSVQSIINKEELNGAFWYDDAQKNLKMKLQNIINENVAKNIVFFLGDGMSTQTVAATRSYLKDEGLKLSFEKFPHTGFSKTYCVNAQVGDSACTATAFLSGVKTNIGTVGVDARISRGQCLTKLDRRSYTRSFLFWGQNAKKATGFVTTSRITHATPAGLYAHISDRDWENNQDIILSGCDQTQNFDIAHQLVHNVVSKNFRVIMGGGRSQFLDRSIKDEDGNLGWRSDGKNLIHEWRKIHASYGNASYIYNREQLRSLDPDKVDYVLGLFSSDHCPYHGDIKRNKIQATQPTLTDMTEKAIKVLQKNTDGFILFVEGARIDMAHHENKARKALEDTAEFENAIKLVLNMTSQEETLIIVTSDHSHTMTINGYPGRNTDILGLSGNKGSDNLPYTTISYASGEGFSNAYIKKGGGRQDLSEVDFSNADYKYPATIPMKKSTHAGEDVPVYAIGPYSHLFVGSYEQNNIPFLLAYASKIGPYKREM